MHITEIFLAPETKAAKLYWLPGYLKLAKTIYNGYTSCGETYERNRHVANCAARWGVTRCCAEAILTDAAKVQIDDINITITRPVVEA